MNNFPGIQNLFHISNSIMLLIDPEDGKILDANQSACDFYGYNQKLFKKRL